MGSTLFLLYEYVNDLENDLLSKVANVADDTKFDGKVIFSEDCDKIQDMNKRTDWREK